MQQQPDKDLKKAWDIILGLQKKGRKRKTDYPILSRHQIARRKSVEVPFGDYIEDVDLSREIRWAS